MATHFISVCVFCFICATHAPCASHAEVTHGRIHDYGYDSKLSNPPVIDNNTHPREKFKANEKSENQRKSSVLSDNNSVHNVHRRDSEITNKTLNVNSINSSNNVNSEEKDYVKKLFSIYGDGETMTLEGFEKLMNRLKLITDSTKSKEELIDDESELFSKENKCVNHSEILSSIQPRSIKQIDPNQKINNIAFQNACPVLIYSMLVGGCLHQEKPFFIVEDLTENTHVLVWVYSIIAVVIISACGVLALAIIPVMQKKFYKPLLQFLIALAVGTLAGDAFLHLLPHAMNIDHPVFNEREFVHSHEKHGEHHEHDANTWKGFVAMMGLTFFFIMERFILLAGKWRKGKVRKEHKHFEVLNGIDMGKPSETQCMERYNPYPHCYRDIISDPHTTYMEPDRTVTTTLNELCSSSDLNSMTKSHSNLSDKTEANQNLTDCTNDLNNTHCTETNKMLPSRAPVTLREHGTEHHGHSHTHGHVYAAPKNFSSVAWMVIMGDGLHNFTDGMAIGAAFAGGITGGLSTTVAVFCHELPHELGDFAMLLKAGMSIKEALFYNLLSSVLCILGNLLGIWLGNTESASSWVFALAAGMFIYIALVDMIPELSSSHEDEGNFQQYILHFTGLLCGFGIMALIAFYEHDLKNIFNESE